MYVSLRLLQFAKPPYILQLFSFHESLKYPKNVSNMVEIYLPVFEPHEGYCILWLMRCALLRSREKLWLNQRLAHRISGPTLELQTSPLNFLNTFQKTIVDSTKMVSVTDRWQFMEHLWNDTDRGNWSTWRKTLYSVGGRWMNEYGSTGRKTLYR
jgi:hypothetical protein